MQVIDGSRYSALSYMVERYLQQRRLAKLGYTAPFSSLDDFEINCFMIIGAKFDEINEAEMKKLRDKKNGNNN